VFYVTELDVSLAQHIVMLVADRLTKLERTDDELMQVIVLPTLFRLGFFNR